MHPYQSADAASQSHDAHPTNSGAHQAPRGLVCRKCSESSFSLCLVGQKAQMRSMFEIQDSRHWFAS